MEPSEKQVYVPQKKKKSGIKTRILGAFVLFFAFIGVVSIIAFSVNTIKTISENNRKAEMERLSKRVSAVVGIAPPAFEKIENISNYTVLKSAVLMAIEQNPAKLQTADDGRMKVSCKLVKSAAQTLFGEDIAIEYVPFDINETLFEYDSENDCYYFPPTGHVRSYQPIVQDYSKSGDTVTLLIEYQAIEPVPGDEQVHRFN